MDILFSFSCWNQINKLNYHESNNLLNIIRETITANIEPQKISEYLTNNQPLIINLRIDENNHLIGILLPLPKVIKLIGFSSETELDLERYSYHSKTIDIDQDLNDIITKIHGNFQLSNHAISSITIEENDFYLRNLTLNNFNNSSIILSTQQKEFLDKNNTLPILLSGNQGTGKTTISLYHALSKIVKNQNNPEYKIVYLTSTQSEQKQVKNIVKTLNKTTPKNLVIKDYQSFTKNFATENELKTKHQFFAQRQITEYKFKEQFCQENNLSNIDINLLWQEIKQLIKGSHKSLKNSQGLITLNDYLAFKHQSLFSLDTDFNQVYEVASQYQQWLENNNYWDQIDLVQHILKKLPDNYSGTYNAIYIDDIDRLSEIEIQLIFKLLKIENKQEYIPQLFITGEDNSHLIRGHFNWGRVKKIALEEYLKSPQWIKIRPSLEPKYFNCSFSTTDKINYLLNCIVNLALRDEAKEEVVFHNQLSWIKSHYKPLIVSTTETEILSQGDRFSGSHSIIVKTAREKEKLANVFPKDSERILLVNEINDLQFDQVLIWNFFENIEDIFQQNRDFQRNFYQDLFVAIKSAKKRIYFYDQFNNSFWNQDEISNLVELGYPTELGEFFSGDREEDIDVVIDNYLYTGSYKAYKICSQIYFQANDILGAARIEALLEEVKGNWGQAGDIWNKLQIFDEAIRCWNEVDGKLWEAKWATTKRENWSQRGLYFEQKRDFDLANFCYDKAKDFAGKLRCLEANNDWEIAGDKCQEKELLSQAQKYYELADKYYQSKGQFQSAVKMWTRLERLDKVALIWENLEQWEKAGNCWQKQGNIQRAADCWQKAQKWSEAQKCWLELGKWNNLGLSYESQGQWVSAAQIWQKEGNLQRAGFCYQNANEWALAEDLWRKLEYWGYVAIALQQQKKWQEAAQMWEKTSPYELQALCYERLENWEKAKEAWLKANKWSQSIICAEKEEKWEEAAESWENLGEWQSAGKAWEKAGEIEKAALCYEQGNFWGEAEECWRQLEDESAIAITLEKQEKWALAGEIWQELGEWKSAGKAWEKAGDIEKAALIYETGNHWREAEECWRLLGNEAKTEAAATKQGTWVAAAHDWLKSNQIEQAALCYEKCQDWERAEKYWQQAKNWEKLAQVSEQQNKWQQAAQAHLKDDHPEKAALCYETLEDWQKAEECWRKAWKWEQLARVCEQQQKWKEAADAWMKADNLEKAVNYYEKIQDWESAEECWRQLSNWERLAIVCENQAKWEEAAQLWTFLNNWQKAALACLAMDDVETAIKYYEKGNYTEEADKLRKNN
ncbi:Tetratricopeptide TPR_1 repeat-containing protein [Cyanobacterium stanieri PCC 7202]|uniref:Tetratricopeptide TPR_1 repeat-containing protein n=1 Tax=Cyanobacterium stanieri (strain ATCC 29140 / PCC 7202) TaxID=292563 RepID=K9YMZ9_CYASC|nr:Tetratricopeptide TPR_1 repeat-containing protein [Cyanobacterium stanieri PCC 7202]